MDLEESFAKVIDVSMARPVELLDKDMATWGLADRTLRVTQTNIEHWVQCRSTGVVSYDETSDCPFCEEVAQLGTDRYSHCEHYVTDHKEYVLWSEEKNGD